MDFWAEIQIWETVIVTSPDVPEMEDKMVLMTRANWQPKNHWGLILMKAKLWERNKTWAGAAYHSSKLTRELGMGTVADRFEMKMWYSVFILNTQYISLGRTWLLIFLDEKAQDPNKLSVKRPQLHIMAACIEELQPSFLSLAWKTYFL